MLGAGEDAVDATRQLAAHVTADQLPGALGVRRPAARCHTAGEVAVKLCVMHRDMRAHPHARVSRVALVAVEQLPQRRHHSPVRIVRRRDRGGASRSGRHDLQRRAPDRPALLVAQPERGVVEQPADIERLASRAVTGQTFHAGWQDLALAKNRGSPSRERQQIA
jgi:hypothetical protein